jgi:adenylosuccinate synthase
MKYLEKYKIFEYDSDLKHIYESNKSDILDLIKDIIFYLKDDYNGIKGDIKILQDDSILLEIDPIKIKFNGDKYTIDRATHIREFISEILEICKRIEEATGKIVKILSIYESFTLSEMSTSSIKIYILDEKNSSFSHK